MCFRLLSNSELFFTSYKRTSYWLLDFDSWISH